MPGQPQIEINESGLVDQNDSAFATLVHLNDQEILCGFSAGGGAHAIGGTQCRRSPDGGRTWSQPTVILDRVSQPFSTNHLRLSRTASGTILAYGQRDYREMQEGRYRTIRSEPILCRSEDKGETWSDPQIIPAQLPGPYEISNPIVVTHDGRWLAPAATHHRELYGEKVVVFESADEGRTWPGMHTVFEHPEKKTGYLEQKLIEFQPNRLIAIAWRQDFQSDADLDNAISFSNDGGLTWSDPLATGVQGQTMTPIWLEEDRFCILYNRRFGEQGVRMCLVRANDTHWNIEYEGTMWDAKSSFHWNEEMSSNEQISKIQFGYPMAVRLDDQTLLATHWCVENGVCGIRWTRLQIHN